MSSQYKCPKCGNILLSSNKILHDLKCTERMPATYANIMNQNIYSSVRNPNSNVRLSGAKGANANNLTSSGLKKSTSGSPFKRSSILNKDGTTTEIKLEKSISGKEELLEITYDPQGNVITRKKAESGKSNTNLGFHEIKEFKTTDEKDNYNIYEGGNVFLQTVPKEEQEKNKLDDSKKKELKKDEQVKQEKKIENTPAQPIEHNYGKHGYTWMQNNINSISVNIDDIRSNKVNNINVPSIKEDLNKYFNYSTGVSNSYNNYDAFNSTNYNYNTNANNNNTNLNNNIAKSYNYTTNYDNIFNNNNYNYNYNYNTNNATTNYSNILNNYTTNPNTNNTTTNYNNILNNYTTTSNTYNYNNNNNMTNILNTNYSNNYTTNNNYNSSYSYNQNIQNNTTNYSTSNFNQNEFLVNYNNSNGLTNATSNNNISYNIENDSDINYREFKFPGFI